MSLLDRINTEPPSARQDKNTPEANPALNEAARQIIANLESRMDKEPRLKTKEDRRAFLKKVIGLHRELIKNSDLNLTELSADLQNNTEQKKLYSAIEQEVLEIFDTNKQYYSRQEKAEIIEAVVSETLGLGPLDELINDSSVSEIMVNGCNKVFVERKGILEETPVIFFDDDHLKRIIVRIVSKIGRHIDEGMPMVDARLKDGSRVNAIIPPIALTGPTLTIRKFSEKGYTCKDLIKFGSLTPAMETFLRLCVEAKLNIIVSGGTGSGKTTLLNALSNFIPNDDRIVTIEDSAELRLQQNHVIICETRPPNIEGTGEITIRDLVRNSLRMRPDRIVVGECRGGETLDMLQAMNTGHDGSMTTAHANSPKDLITRLETMVLMAGVDLPIKAIRQQIASAFDLVIQQSRLQDGSRKIVKISEVCGIEEDLILMNDIFVFEQTGVHSQTRKVEGAFKPTGIVPDFLHKLEAKGLKVPIGIFGGL
ncbi:MAG: CpaF family protein [Candidatus Margulisbacteria bacterium]|jgi:pilus assembly protein CpaF|nr:CpaF family protein [Candidatus Margulisiibacteriota bacterium]